MTKKILFLFLSMFAFCTVVHAESGLNIFAYPREAPQTEFYTINGTKVQLSDFKGKFLLVNFWSRNCVPCIKELDNLNNFVNKTKDDGIRVIIISKASEWQSVAEQREFLEKFKAPDLDFYLDKDGKLAESFGIFASPHTVLVNSAGEEIGRIRGSAEWDSDEIIEYIYKIKAEHNTAKE